MKPRKLPDYDPKSGENPFVWILRAAADVREKRQAEREREYFKAVERRAPDRWTGR